MQAAFDRATLDRLVALGRSQGGLGPDDLRRALPVDRMSAEDIAMVLIELEEAGISVDPDDSLLSSGRPLPPAGTVRLPEPATGAPPPPAPDTPSAATAAPAPTPRAAAPPAARGGAHRAVTWAVIWAGLAALVLALLVLALWAGRS
ncbi:Sigma-70 factor, region 1.1 [Methylobacterium sp. 174MFSha1.1]|uniref:RNA polymerase sigma factor region1.1 domain-containing protein n=1 Tax=Methylobacterium sp. 174MFSha1.1 TaxID=1502749 RepID=UPI0008E79DFE|nr:RNA polymerase sigma factor region1.1 domain-containing protein [Methylobacterium sp. 174MFSha1.1]SFU41626.1 Sigma-70 factor, region 1.1 [Methylobacterium sp. 174MFSha1.1]